MVNKESLTDMKYSELQKLAKSYGIKANAKVSCFAKYLTNNALSLTVVKINLDVATNGGHYVVLTLTFRCTTGLARAIVIVTVRIRVILCVTNCVLLQANVLVAAIEAYLLTQGDKSTPAMDAKSPEVN